MQFSTFGKSDDEITPFGQDRIANRGACGFRTDSWGDDNAS
jgi:hypothetical protein